VKIVAHFEIPYYQFLNENSEIIAESVLFEESKKLLHLYRLMTLIRLFDSKAIALQRTGKLGTYPSTRGQEAVFVGMGHALLKEDIFVPYYRDIGTLIQRGVKLSEILLFWGGDERGNCFVEDKVDFPYSVPVGSQPLHAAGAAFAIKYRQEKRAVLSTCGDGATSQGDFYEALNIAGAWKLPVVFVVCNNQWAISVPRHAQTAAETIAQKAIGAGLKGEQVDGNDVVAVAERVAAALTRAREAHEPSLLELICYRQHDHTTADDARRYEPSGLREQEWKKEPVMRLRRYLEKKNMWTEAQEHALQVECTAEVDQAVQEYVSVTPQSLASMFDYLYAQLPQIYEEQRAMVMEKSHD
jgi:2-oxoisovalerate dehydrogenase E1 component alpha subunit